MSQYNNSIQQENIDPIQQMEDMMNQIPPQHFETRPELAPNATKKSIKEFAKQQKVNSMKFSCKTVPDDLRRTILQGFLAYLDEYKANKGKTHAIQNFYCKIRDNFIKTRGYGEYPVDSLTPGNIAKVIDNEKKKFAAALARINKSGAAAKKYVHFELAFAIWRSDHATIVEFRRGNKNKNDELDDHLISNEEVFESIDSSSYNENVQENIARSTVVKEKKDDEKTLRIAFLKTANSTQDKYGTFLDCAMDYLQWKRAGN